MLMASCETTRALASMLNVVTDRLAVLCTSPINDHRTLGSDFTRIWPLSNIKVRKLKTVLDAIANTKEKSTACSWTNTIDVATDILLQPSRLDSHTESLQDTFGHVIVLTNSAGGLSANMLSHEKLQFHVICPASVPLNDFDKIVCNGWKMRSISGEEPPVKDKTSSALLNKLQRLITHARSGRNAGKLTYLSLEIKAGRNCRIEDLMGLTEYLTLHPGEIHTVIVRLKIQACALRENPLACSATLPELGVGSAEILKKIDTLLKVGPRPGKVLTARLKYKHTLLPENTTCSVSADCKVKKQVISIPAEKQLENFVAGPAECTSKVHQRLAYHLATHNSPIDSLKAFREEFGNEGWRSPCPDYTHLVLKELKYQARILQRLEIDASPKKRSLPLTMDMLSSPESDYEQSISKDICNDDNHRPDSWCTDEESSPSNLSQHSLLAKGRQLLKRDPHLIGDADEGKDSRSGSRMTSKGPKHLIKGRAMSLKREELGNQTQGRPPAAQRQRSDSQPIVTHKSSIGAFSLRRMRTAGELMSKGLGGI